MPVQFKGLCSWFLFPADELGFTNKISAFLDPNISEIDMLHGVSFASAGSGYDELTANFSVSFLTIF